MCAKPKVLEQTTQDWTKRTLQSPHKCSVLRTRFWCFHPTHILEQSVRLGYNTSNNKVGYKVFIVVLSKQLAWVYVGHCLVVKTFSTYGLNGPTEQKTKGFKHQVPSVKWQTENPKISEHVLMQDTENLKLKRPPKEKKEDNIQSKPMLKSLISLIMDASNSWSAL